MGEGACLLNLFEIIEFHTVNIISLTSVGRAFENLGKKLKLKVSGASGFRRSNAKRREQPRI